jgi:hypothetical protein
VRAAGRTNRPWSEADKTRLKELWNAGASALAIRTTLGRTQSAIERMRDDLGLPARNEWVTRRGLAKKGTA